jgi:hypothetical protein
MLGDANLSQTSRYLHVSEMGLTESMRRFDISRGKNEARIEETRLLSAVLPQPSLTLSSRL